MALSLVNSGTWVSATAEASIQVDGYPGGVYIVQADTNGFSSTQTLTMKLFSRVNPGSPLSLYKSQLITAVVDPVIVQLGPIFTTELVDFRMFAGTASVNVPWRLFQAGRCSSLNAGTWTETGTETILASYAYSGVFHLIVDASNLGGDTVVARAYVREGSGSGGTLRSVLKTTVTFSAGAVVIFEVGPVATNDFVKFTLQRTSGAGTAAVPWKTFRLGT